MLPLEPSAAELLASLDVTGRWLAGYVEGLRTRPAFDEGPHRSLPAEAMPERGASLDALLPIVFEQLVVSGVNPASPGCLSYVNGGGLWQAALAGLIANVTNRFVGYAAACPALAELEGTVVRWLTDLARLPSETSGGVLLTGGSMANFTAMIAARRTRLAGKDLSSGVVYASEQTHHSIQKGAMLAGLSNVRTVPVDAALRVRVDALQAMIREDLAAGLTPFCVVGVAGATNTGAVDDLESLALVAKRHELWFHVDAAYGGFFLLTERGRDVLRGIEHADSITMDPHKSLFFPFGMGCLLVRDVARLAQAHQMHSACVASLAEDAERAGQLNFADLSVEQTREARGLVVWLTLKMIGVAALREALDEKLDLARYAAAEIARMPLLELVVEPQLSSFAFRAALPGMDAASLDALTQRILDDVNAGGQVHLAPTTIDGRLAIRVCVLVFRTHKETVDLFLSRLHTAVSLGSAPSIGHDKEKLNESSPSNP